MGLNVDSDGSMIGYDDYERGVVAYIVWLYMLQNFEQYNQYVIETWEGVWKAQKRWIKGSEQQRHFNNTKRQIASTMNAWIVSKTWAT